MHLEVLREQRPMTPRDRARRSHQRLALRTRDAQRRLETDGIEPERVDRHLHEVVGRRRRRRRKRRLDRLEPANPFRFPMLRRRTVQPRRGVWRFWSVVVATHASPNLPRLLLPMP